MKTKCDSVCCSAARLLIFKGCVEMACVCVFFFVLLNDLFYKMSVVQYKPIRTLNTWKSIFYSG